ncbi:reducing type I polyketide synthase [Lindgomyces ingoldianus]|uniref:Reducing type I polyketide synthase n=1 Tax=Lindgomyces ingoldianus TaxID=673940 RepID=A0ACB6QAL7_9PLEO|nr:reducing type I polyketide synthase [Lindgomyces ingoldianus]KAF2464008.1 reducing type I polyketide synthase [Lindgomyces ingoldianus]
MASLFAEHTPRREISDSSGRDPVAVVGFSFQFPGGCDTANAFWQTLVEKRNTGTEAPKERYSSESLFHPDTTRRGTVGFRGGHFLSCDVAKFDAPFFNISDTEAAALDPQQRMLLETAFRALENAGQVIDRVVGSNTSVFTGCFCDDWKFLSTKDAEQCASHTALGVTSSMLANRLSWFFNLKGSSSLMAIDLACKSLVSRNADMSLAAGCNLLVYPDNIHTLSNLGLLSPDSQSYPFDNRANGYARGDGFGVLVLKRRSDAIANNDIIRAVIRGTGSNQDGYTTSITHPSGNAQAELIMSTYSRAGLSLSKTRFVEAHGTGTPIGDPIELNAIGTTFKSHRSPDEPLYVGGVKSNIGHLGGASGIAGVIKTILVLEKGVIPPNANFVTLNPEIDLDFLRIRLPQVPTTWPSKGLRRASVNSFGFAGSNSHIILDDAYHYLLEAGLEGNHNTVCDPETPVVERFQIGVNGHSPQKSSAYAVKDVLSTPASLPRLLVLSASDKATLMSQIKAHTRFLRNTDAEHSLTVEFLHDLSYTLNERRNIFTWRSAAVVDSPEQIQCLESLLSNPQRSLDEPALCFVFAGQGAQYAGDQLRFFEKFDIFRDRLTKAEEYLLELGCKWRVRYELFKPKKESQIDNAEFSQPLSSIVQIALIDLLRSFGVYPKVVLGHSSGEIAAAYCLGAISAHSAIKLAYFRGYHAANLVLSGGHHGAMMAVSLSAQEMEPYLSELESETGRPRLAIACINSPKNVTISGERHQIDDLQRRLSQQGVFSRKLKVNVAYHSSSMQTISEQYFNSIGSLEKGTSPPHVVTMLSTVTCQWVPEQKLQHPQYWVNNMLLPVQFSAAVGNLTFEPHRQVWKRLDCSHMNHPKTTCFLEVGFHGALRGPLRDILSIVPGGSKVLYETVLVRNEPPLRSLFESLARLFCHGCTVDFRAVNGAKAVLSRAPKLLCNLPEYEFNHSKGYWEENRISKRYRLHPQGKLDLLGKPCPDWNKAEAKWRNFIRVSEMPWVEDHVINGEMIYPGAGMLVMAIEAAHQIAEPNREIEGFELKDIRFLSTLTIPRTSNGIETHLYLREVRDVTSSEIPWSEFRLFSFGREDWHENCRGAIRVQYKAQFDEKSGSFNRRDKKEAIEAYLARESTTMALDSHVFEHEGLYSCLRDSGFQFGPSFQRIRNGRFIDEQATADIELYEWPQGAFPQPHIVHPCSLDAMLHLALAALAKGGSAAIPTAVPSSCNNLWISKDGLSTTQAKSVRTCVWMVDSNARGSDYNLFVLDNVGNKVLAQGDGLRLTIVSRNTPSNADQSDENQICHQLRWKPDITFMTYEQLVFYCEQARLLELPVQEIYEDLTFVVVTALTGALKKLKDVDLSSLSIHHMHYFEWATKQLSRCRDGTLPCSKPEWSDFQSNEPYLLQKYHYVSKINNLGRAVVDTAHELPQILQGQTRALAHLYKSFLRGVNSFQTCFCVLVRFLDAVSHKGGHLKMLEIGLDPATRMLTEHEFAEYAKVDFKVFNANQDAASQGIESGGYDIIFAANILAFASDVDNAFQNLRNLLRTGGRLILYECTRPSALLRTFITSLFPGWGTRIQALDSVVWATALCKNGFAGIDLEIPDFPAPEFHENSIMIATAVSRTNSINGISKRVSQTSRVTIIADLRSEFQKGIVHRLQSIVSEDYGVMALSEATQMEGIGTTSFIFLDELEHEWLINLSEADYAALRKVLTTCKASLWVTNGGGVVPQSPASGVAHGLFRVLRSERPEYPLATLGLAVTGSITDNQISHIHRIFQSIIQYNDPSAQDQEFVEFDGQVDTCPPVRLSIDSIGVLDTLHFIEDDTYCKPLQPDEVEIQISAAGLNFRDILVALGRVPGSEYGSEAAGVVSRVGSLSLDISPGDRVVVAGVTLRTFVRAKSYKVLKIEDNMTFPEAASIPTQFCTAWQAIHELARIQEYESILIHTGAGGTGQAAIQVAQYIGATIYTTVGSESKKQLLIQEYGIPESHIFNSRDTSFAKGIMRITNGRGVDVILNSLAGDSLIASWECIAPYGRFIELGKKDILQNSKLPMRMFHHSTSFVCLDGFGFHQDQPKASRKIFEKVMWMFREGVLRPVKPLNVFPVNRVEDAFRSMQDGRSAGKFVLEMGKSMEIRATLRNMPTFSVNDHSTYVIAGGLGGLGRNVSRWLVDRGARHLLLLSRSGASTEPGQTLLGELKACGVQVQAPLCDVTKFELMKGVIEECSHQMPPIRGCVQGSMVLRDSTFNRMPYTDWRAGTDCKTIGSWNLHKLLPNNLDFFIMLSSASGVVGLHGQANYAAGNAYMDALAQYRVSIGLRATSLDLGALKDDGLLAENPDFLNRVLSYGALNGISRTYFNAIMDYYCNPSLPQQTPMQSQPIIGLGTGEDGIIKSRNPIFCNLKTDQHASSSSTSSSPDTQDWRSIFKAPADHDIASLITSALIEKLSKTNSSLQGEVDVVKPLVAYGVDSLLAVELRSWMAREFGADVALFEIQGVMGFERLGRVVAERSTFRE